MDAVIIDAIPHANYRYNCISDCIHGMEDGWIGREYHENVVLYYQDDHLDRCVPTI